MRTQGVRFWRRRLSLSGFTTIELLVAVAVIALLVALLLPAVQSARESARRNQCRNHLRQLGVAIQNYESALRRFPPGAVRVEFTTGNRYRMPFIAQILPNIEQSALANQMDFSRSWHQPPNSSLLVKQIPLFICPATPHREAS